jgi:hypothetical protein
MLIDDIGRDDFVSTLGTSWKPISDRVMGGISRAALDVEEYAGRRCLHLSGDVCLDNDGGFIQMGLDLDPLGSTIDARQFAGLRLVTQGNAEVYAVHIRTADVVRSWQSYRAQFQALPKWREVRLPFTDFVPHRIETSLDLSRLRRVGLVAIGREFFADLRVAEIAFY